MVSSQASDAAQNLVDAVNKGEITGWDIAASVLVIVASIPLARVAAAAVSRACDGRASRPTMPPPTSDGWQNGSSTSPALRWR